MADFELMILSLSFPGGAEPSHSHSTENIPDSRENWPEGPHRHHLSTGQKSTKTDDASLGLLASCLCLLGLWKNKSYFAVGGGGRVKDEVRVGSGVSTPFVWICSVPPNAAGFFSYLSMLHCCLISIFHHTNKLPLWRKMGVLGNY